MNTSIFTLHRDQRPLPALVSHDHGGTATCETLSAETKGVSTPSSLPDHLRKRDCRWCGHFQHRSVRRRCPAWRFWLAVRRSNGSTNVASARTRAFPGPDRTRTACSTRRNAGTEDLESVSSR